MFPVKRVERQAAESLEQIGSKRKFWFTQAGKRVLFKAEERGTGEDWAEKVACEICGVMGIPHVHYELADEYDRGAYVQRGVVCETVAALLRELQPPSVEWLAGAPEGLETALDVFTGYIMVDVLTANQDRHHENWGAISAESLRLAPTFDHGACLARNLSDREREERLRTRDRNRAVAYFAERARSEFYEASGNARVLSTLEAFQRFAVQSPRAARAWIGRVERLEPARLRAILDEVPANRMSEIAKDFTHRLLIVNRERVLSVEF